MLAAAALMAVPAGASAEVKVHTQTVGPITVGGYEVQQNVRLAPHPNVDGKVTRMEVDVVDGPGPNAQPVPINRLMLHHIVFANLNRQDATCDSILGFDERPNSMLSSERFYAAGEERAKMVLPPGYGYELHKNHTWGLLYMFMNHRPQTDTAWIQYKMTVATGSDEPPNEVTPYWLDVENCRADPVYDVPGTKKPGSKHRKSSDVVMPESGRIVAGGGHVHGGAYKLTLTKPGCDGQRIGESVPTWGKKSHPFYKVRPVLHEPGPIAMSGFLSQTGIPVAKGEAIRLNSIYDNSLPHTRVMGISIVYVDHDENVSQPCGPPPDDIWTGTDPDTPEGRKGPIRYRIPLTGLDKNGNAVTIRKPKGKTKRLRSGATVEVGDRFFSRPNVRLKRGGKLKWRFSGGELHNVTLANGPVGFGSPNLDGDRTFAQKFRRSGKYRLFCALHPVQMHERVVVKGKK
jgi:plastocyanin